MELKTVLNDLRSFVEAEHKANYEKIYEIWDKPTHKKLESGESQKIIQVEKDDKHHIQLTLGENESRFREGDMICLHLGNPKEKRYIVQGTIEAEKEGEWLVRAYKLDDADIAAIASGCFADPDTMDLKPFYEEALDDIANSAIGRDVVLPLLAGKLDTSLIYEDNYDDAADRAEKEKLNSKQVDAVGKGVAAKHLACIQGPPGTGKTKVISLIAKLLVEDGQRVLITSHTHMAINNALNKIAQEQVPVIKVGASGCKKGLDEAVAHFEYGIDWKDQPDSGYVIGATPFATCSERLEKYQFDTVIFDEASQITLPLAVMAMRKATRFVFVGDHKQLPPVVLSKSVLDDSSIFFRLISRDNEEAVMLSQTYRMCHALSRWPSERYYDGYLTSSGSNASKSFILPRTPKMHAELLSGDIPFIFIKTPGINSRSSNQTEAELVTDIIVSAIDAGLDPEEVGVVTPFRRHAKALKSKLAAKLGLFSSKSIVADTVERMQGQEREMIIVSLCASDPQYLNAIASFFFQAERLNVAITRPKTKLIIIGPELPVSFKDDSNDPKLKQNIDAYRSLVSSAHHAMECN